MKYLDGRFFVEVKDHRYKIHPTENIILRLRDEPKSLRIQYQVQNETQIRRNQKVTKNDNDLLTVKSYPKNKKPPIQQQKFKPPNCPSCKRNNWLEQKHQIDKKVFRQDHDFSTRLNFANKKIREIYINMVNTTYSSIKDMIDKLQQLKRKTKIKFYKKINNYYIEMKTENFQTQKDTFSKNAKGISKIFREVLLLLKYLQTKPQVKIMNIIYYDLYYTVIKIRDENKDTDIQYENDQNDYNNFNDIINPKHYIGIKRIMKYYCNLLI